MSWFSAPNIIMAEDDAYFYAKAPAAFADERQAALFILSVTNRWKNIPKLML